MPTKFPETEALGSGTPFEVAAATIVGVFGTYVYSMIDHFIRE
jgi:hypothetical protein